MTNEHQETAHLHGQGYAQDGDIAPARGGASAGGSIPTRGGASADGSIPTRGGSAAGALARGHSHGRSPGQTHSHNHAHSHANGHAHGCLADHHDGEYTPQQRADLDLVLAFNHRLSEAIDACLDTGPTVRALDPDPLRYMWVDEGAGQIPAQLARAGEILDLARPLAGHTRARAEAVPGSNHAARPSIATASLPGGDRRTLLTWIEWVEGAGDRLLARIDEGEPQAVLPGVADVFRPTAAIAGDGTPWVFFGRRSPAGEVGVWASRREALGWSVPVAVSDTGGPSFNQEVVTHPDGSLEVVWQGARDARFGVYTRRFGPHGWGPSRMVTADVEANVWDPTVVPTTRGSVFAWAQYADGSYVIGLRHRVGDRLGPLRVLTGGTDYALHPSLAVTGDGRLWCAFDVITVTGHGASGPTRLARRPGTAADPTAGQDGMRPPGDSVPPELLPEVGACLRVVCVDDDWPAQLAGPAGPSWASAAPDVSATGSGAGSGAPSDAADPTAPSQSRSEEPGHDLSADPDSPSPDPRGRDSAAWGSVGEPISAGLRLQEAPGLLGGGLDVVPSALPRLLATPDGGLIVGYRVHRQLPLMTYYWEAAAQILGPSGWEPPLTLAETDATLEEVSLAVDAAGAVLATQGDGRLQRALHWTEGFGGRECPYLADHHGAVIWHGVHGAGRIVTAPIASAGRACPPHRCLDIDGPVTSSGRVESRRWRGAATADRRYQVRSQGQEYTLYWGDLHRHSLVSRCTSGDEPSLEDFYRYAWDVCEYDFWAVTDHAENSTSYQWWSIQKIADLLHVPHLFVPLYGFEWTSAASGHQNVIYGDVDRGAPIFSAFAEGTSDPAGLWAALAEHPDYPAVTIPHHPGSAMVYNDWDYHDPRYSRLVEVFQACRGNYESMNCFRQYSDGTAAGTFTVDGLTRGHRFGLIASSDHGHGASYVGVLARSLTRADVFDALWSRRTFAATTRDIVIDLRCGDHLMGSEVIYDEPPEFTVHTHAYGPIARVDLLRGTPGGSNAQVVHSVQSVHSLRGGERPRDGELRVDLRVEWGEAQVTTDWDGSLSISGGRIVVPEFVGPEVTSLTESEVTWAHRTISFGEPYGAQRGCVELSLLGPADALVHVRSHGRDVTMELGRIAEALAVGDLPLDPPELDVSAHGRLVLQASIGALDSLGVTNIDLSWSDPDLPADPHGTFYYARVILLDGEMAWSSPIWVDRG